MNPEERDVAVGYRPKLIVWQLEPREKSSTGDPASHPLATNECLLVIDSISRTGRPIVVFTGAGLLKRPDLLAIIEYGTALGLKINIEADPREIVPASLEAYAKFGPKIFRIVIDNCLIEDFATRFKETEQFFELERAVALLRDHGFEVHLSVNMKKLNVRELAYDLDYAVRKSATGLYCHLSLDWQSEEIFAASLDELIESIAKMKGFLPKEMYFSPQCLKYGMNSDRWLNWCMAAKSFAYIDAEGRVKGCSNIADVSGNLRDSRYNFKRIWDESEEFQKYRKEMRSCVGTRRMLDSAK